MSSTQQKWIDPVTGISVTLVYAPRATGAVKDFLTMVVELASAAERTPAKQESEEHGFRHLSPGQ